MYVDFSKLFQRQSKDPSDQGTHFIPKDETTWPEEWKTRAHKTYGRLARIALSNSSPASELFELIAARKSKRKFHNISLTLEELSVILKYSCGETNPSKRPGARAQPSGGGLYPIEAYVINFQHSEDFPSGVYHYDVAHHNLAMLWQRNFTKEEIGQLFSYEWVQDSSVALVFTGVFNRTKMKYGQRGYRYTLVEAGHIGQNIYLTSGALGIGCCAGGGARDEVIEKLLTVDGTHESLVYSLILGK